MTDLGWITHFQITEPHAKVGNFKREFLVFRSIVLVNFPCLSFEFGAIRSLTHKRHFLMLTNGVTTKKIHQPRKKERN